MPIMDGFEACKRIKNYRFENASTEKPTALVYALLDSK